MDRLSNPRPPVSRLTPFWRVGALLAPGFGELFQRRVGRVRQGDDQPGQQIAAGSPGVDEAAALEPQLGAAVGALGHGQGHRAVRRRRVDLAAKDGVGDRHRQVHMQDIAVAAVEGVRPDADLDQGVAGAGPAAGALALQAKRLAVLGALGDDHLERAAVGEGDALLAAANGLLKVYVQVGPQVLPPAAAAAKTEAAAARARSATLAEHVAEDVVDIHPLEAGTAGTGAVAAARGAAGAERTAAAEAGMLLAAVGVDLAPI